MAGGVFGSLEFRLERKILMDHVTYIKELKILNSASNVYREYCLIVMNFVSFFPENFLRLQLHKNFNYRIPTNDQPSQTFMAETTLRYRPEFMRAVSHNHRQGKKTLDSFTERSCLQHRFQRAQSSGESGRKRFRYFNNFFFKSKDDVTGEPLVQRDDDREEVVQKRLQDYENMTRPVIDFYRNLGILHDFQGEATNEIWPKVFKCLAAEVPLRNDKISAAA